MKILVPCDFSENSQKAALYAAEIAKRTHSDLFLLHVMELGYEKIRQPFRLHDKYDEIILQTSSTEITELGDSIKTVYNIEVQSELTVGNPSESIIEFAKRKRIGLIVMGTKGAGKVKEALIGTVAASVAVKSKIPVMVIPREYQLEQPDRILFTTNHFERNKRTLAVIINLARIFSAVIYVVVFLDMRVAKPREYLEKGKKIDRYLRFLTKTYPDIEFKVELIEGANFENAIRLYHAKNGTDIAAMVTYPKRFWEQIFLKSSTKKMVYHSHLPVLAIPADPKLQVKKSRASHSPVD